MSEGIGSSEEMALGNGNAQADARKSKKSELRLLFKKCASCSYLFPWAEEVNACVSDPECPAHSFTFTKGRDPQKMIEHFGGKLAEALVNDDRISFKETFKALSSNKEARKHIFDIMREIVEQASYVTCESDKEVTI